MNDEELRRALQPATALWNMYDPENAEFAFRATDADEARTWQRVTADALAGAVGFQDLPRTPLQPQHVESVDKGDYMRHKVILRTGPDMAMPVYLLIPKDAAYPLPCIMALNGHGYGVKDLVGLWEDGTERNAPDGAQKDFAITLCRQGFAVAAPEISCFGERQTDFSYLNTVIGQGVPTSCTHAAALAAHLGRSAIGLRVNDGKRLIDYLESREEFDTNRLGAMGLSGGGLHTFYSTCLDARIRACVVSGYFSTFRGAILAMHHCPCNFVPGLHRFGEMYDLAGLIAPRPMLVESGSMDPIFPIESVREAMQHLRRIYRVFGAEDRLEVDYFEGRHQISGARAFDFLREHLAPGIS